jgi:uncharacterized protein with von Willebrand factor type A (vWA) domain
MYVCVSSFLLLIQRENMHTLQKENKDGVEEEKEGNREREEAKQITETSKLGKMMNSCGGLKFINMQDHPS